MNERTDEEEYKRARGIVFRRLAIRGYTTHELKTVLAEKGISPPIIDKIINEGIHLGYCNDGLMVEEFIRSHKAKKWGPRAIVMKLKAKGISQELIEEKIDQLNDPTGHVESIRKLLTTRYKTRDLSDFNERQKIIAALFRRGFTLDVIKQALEQQIS